MTNTVSQTEIQQSAEISTLLQRVAALEILAANSIYCLSQTKYNIPKTEDRDEIDQLEEEFLDQLYDITH